MNKTSSCGIVFLDIDGVLNSETFYNKRYELIHGSSFDKMKDGIRKYIIEYFPEFDDKQIDRYNYKVFEIDYEALSLLNHFCIQNNLDVVISSTWRSGFTINELRKFLKFCLGMHDDSNFMRIIDYTPYTKERIRGVEIWKWLLDNINIKTHDCYYFDYKTYLIIDDNSDMLLCQKNNFFKCDGKFGITKQYINKLQKFIDSKKFKNMESKNMESKSMESKSMKNITLIACVDKYMGIGYENNLLFYLREDMKNFKALTIDKVVVMGYDTYKSMGILSNRKNIIVTKNHYTELVEKYKGSDNVGIINDLDAYIDSLNGVGETFIIGGESIYNNSIFNADKLVITHVDKVCDNVDRYFPEINTRYWKCIDTVKHEEDVLISDITPSKNHKIKYSIKTYIRK